MTKLLTRRRRLRSPEERVGTLPNADLPPPAAPVNEEETLLRRALHERDDAAFRAAYERFHPAMIRLARMHVRTLAEAEDVVQDTWLGAIRGVDRFQGRSTLKTWLFRILRNRARTTAVRAVRTVPFTAIAGDDDSLPTGEPPLWSASAHRASPAREHSRRELLARLEAALRTLPARQQEVVTLRDVEGWSAADVCNVLRISPTNQRVLLHRARTRLRDVLRPFAEELDCHAE